MLFKGLSIIYKRRNSARLDPLAMTALIVDLDPNLESAKNVKNVKNVGSGSSSSGGSGVLDSGSIIGSVVDIDKTDMSSGREARRKAKEEKNERNQITRGASIGVNRRRTREETRIESRREKSRILLKADNNINTKNTENQGEFNIEIGRSDSKINSIEINSENNQQILNLMRFEDLHGWLAPTGTNTFIFFT